MQVNKQLFPLISRPAISEYTDPVSFLRDMLQFRKTNQKSFSVLQATRGLRKVSPALVSLILKNKRKITIDRLDEFSKLMDLTAAEKMFFKNWLRHEENPVEQKKIIETERRQHKKEFAISLLNDWLNVYVKDAFRIVAVQKNPQLIYKELGTIASKKRIDQSLKFLLQEGFLRKTLEGHIVVETSLTFNESPPPGAKVRAFHKAALSIAKQNMEIFLPHERFANTLVLDLSPKRYQLLVELIQQFGKALQDFSAVEKENGDRLYQVLINLSPTGGRIL